MLSVSGSKSKFSELFKDQTGVAQRTHCQHAGGAVHNCSTSTFNSSVLTQGHDQFVGNCDPQASKRSRGVTGLVDQTARQQQTVTIVGSTTKPRDFVNKGSREWER